MPAPDTNPIRPSQPAAVPNTGNGWPVTFDGGAADCFGWFHADRAAAWGDVAILICPAFDRDALDSHHGIRLLAEEVAAAGYPCLRFDYPGLGDSCEPGRIEHWGAWLDSVNKAGDWLRATTGARRLVFCGLRIGAALATLATEARNDVAALILLAPVLRGRSYIRQLQIEAQIQTGLPEDGQGGLDFHELQLSAETMARIGEVDLRRLRPRAVSIAIHSQTDSLLLRECVEHWNGAGAAVASMGFAGLEPLLQHNLVEECSPPDFSAVMGWLRGTLSPRPIPPGAGCFPPVPAVLHPAGCRETALRFGPDDRLFGILCEPDGARVPDAPAVIIGNTGRDPHYGFARFGVELARRLAAAGFASLRIDFAGLGDSAGPPGRERLHSHMFEVDRGPDIGAAIDALRQFGYRRFASAGTCAGAYHALHAALADPRVETLLLINLPVFQWRVGDTVDFLNRRTAPAGPFLAQMKGRALWRRLARGEVHVGRFLHAQGVRLAAQLQQVRRRALRRLGLGGPPSMAQTALAVLADRRARTLFLFAAGDSGLSAFELEFGPRGAGARAFAGTTLDVVAGLDHHLSTGAMRRTAIDRMIAFLAVSTPPALT